MSIRNGGGNRWRGGLQAATRASRASVLPTETIHERSARLQREQGLSAEVGPGQHIIPIQTMAPLAPSDPYATPDMRRLVATYGEHQVGAFASQYSAATLREIASSLGIAHPGRSRVEMVSTITAHVTHGRYSANFSPATSTRKTTSRAARARPTSRATSRSKADTLPPLVPIHTDAPLAPSDPYSPPDPARLIRTYGAPQLARALQEYSVDSLKQTAAKIEADHRGTKPMNRGQRNALIDYIVRYSTPE